MYKNGNIVNIKPHSDAVSYLKELPFYNKPTKNQKLND